jgi:hypothetical protein
MFQIKLEHDTRDLEKYLHTLNNALMLENDNVTIKLRPDPETGFYNIRFTYEALEDAIELANKPYPTKSQFILVEYEKDKDVEVALIYPEDLLNYTDRVRAKGYFPKIIKVVETWPTIQDMMDQELSHRAQWLENKTAKVV